MIQQYIFGDNGNVFDNSGSMFTFLSGFPDGLKLWLRADKGVTTDANDKVSEWQDQSGNGYNALQSNEPSRPLLVPSVLNGKPVLQFDGAQFMTANFGQTFAQPNTVFVVYEVPLPQATSLAYITDGINSTQRNTVFIRDNAIELFAGTSNFNTPITADTPTLITGTYNGASSEIRLNGELMATGNAGAQATSGFTIGARFSQDNFLNGDIAEIIFYDRLLSETERQSVEQYLISKYAL